MLCEAKIGHIANMKIYTTERKNLEEMVMSVLENNFDFYHHVYQDHFYNNMKLGENPLDHKEYVIQ
jgi:hypothetical protein